MANPKSEATYESQQQNIKAQTGLKQQELSLGETQLQQQNQFAEQWQGKEYALADQYAKQNLGLSLADIYAQMSQQRHELPITLNQIESQAAASGAFLSKGRIQGQQEARYNEQQALGSLGRSAQRSKLGYSQQISTEKLALQKLKAGDILGYQQLVGQDALKRQGLSLEEQKSLMDLQNSYAKTLSVSDIQNALINGAISTDDATKRLEAMGYSSGDAALIVGGYTSKKGSAAGGKNLTVAEIQKAVKDGLMSPADGLSTLEGLGYNSSQAGLLLKEAGTASGSGSGLTGIYFDKFKDPSGNAVSSEISIGRGDRISDTRAESMRTHTIYQTMSGLVDSYLNDAASSGQKPTLKGLVTYVQANGKFPGAKEDDLNSYLSLVLYDLSQGGPPPVAPKQQVGNIATPGVSD